jgi:hypothetical protein
MPDFEKTMWMPSAEWPEALRQGYFYWAQGRAADLRGARTRMEVTFGRGPDRSARIDAAWHDEAGSRVFHAMAIVGAPKSTLTYASQAGVQAHAVAALDECHVSVERNGHCNDYPLSAEMPFQWRVVWPLTVQFVPWRAGLTGSLSLFDLATAQVSPFWDEPTSVFVTTEDGDAMVSSPNGGQRSVACWLITARGAGWSEVAWIGKNGEGLIRFDLHATDSAIMMGRAG